MKRLSAGLLLLTAVLSCVKEDFINDRDSGSLVPKTFVAESVSKTRTSLVDGRQVHWTEGDRISVFAEGDGTNREFVAASVAGNIAEFSGRIKTVI